MSKATRVTAIVKQPSIKYKLSITVQLWINKKHVTDKKVAIMTHFCWRYVFDNCRMDWGSFWSWFDLYRSSSRENMRENRFLRFRSQWPWSLTFGPQLCSPSYPCSGTCLHEVYTPFRFRVSRGHGRTDGRTECNALCDLLGWAA